MNKKVILVILALGLLLRLIKLDQSFWLDEASQAQLSSQSLTRIWSGRGGDFHPPLFYVLAHFWLKLGTSETWLRLLPVSFGVANIYLIYLFTNTLFPHTVFNIKKLKLEIGAVAAFLLAVNPFHVYYSQEFRSYSLLALLGTLSMYLFFKKKYLWAAVVNAALLYTHYSSIFLLATQFIISPVTIYYSLFTLLLALPWLPHFIIQLHSGAQIDTLPGWRNLLTLPALKSLPVIIFKLVAGRINLVSKYFYAVYIVFVLVSAFLAWLAAASHRRFLTAWILFPIVASVLVSFVIPQTQPFRLIYLLPGLIIIFTQACLRFPRLFLTIFIYIAVFGNITYFTRPRLQREQWRQAISFLGHQPQGPILVKFPGVPAPFSWYDPGLPVHPVSATLPVQPASLATTLASYSNTPRLYLLDYLGDLTDPHHLTEQTLTNLGFSEQHVYNFEGVGFIRQFQK